MLDGSVFHFLVILLLYSIQTLSSANHQVYTSSFDPRDFFLFSYLISLNHLKPVSWFITLNFLPYSTVFLTDFSELYTFILSSLSIQMTLFTCFFNFLVTFHFLWLEKGMAVTSWPVLVVVPRLVFTAPNLGKTTRAGADFPRITNTIPAILVFEVRHLRL